MTINHNESLVQGTPRQRSSQERRELMRPEHCKANDKATAHLWTLLLACTLASFILGGRIPAALAQLHAGDILVTDREAGTGTLGALFQVDPMTGTRILLRDFGKPEQGTPGVDPEGVAVETAGDILVTDREAGTGFQGALFRVDPTTGTRTVLSDFGNATQGPTGITPVGLVQFTPSNQAPVANNDAYSVAEDTGLTVPAPGVLGNDTDTNGNALTVVLVNGPAHGTLTLHANGAFTYTPNPNFNGTDQFTYKATDGAQDSNQAVVTITVSAVNDPPVALADGPVLGLVGQPVKMDASASTDPEGAALTFRWDFGDGTTLVTPQAISSHTYASAGTFAVTLVVNDGQLDSAPFTTQATIGMPGGGQREDVDDFLAYASPVDTRTDLPAGTTSFNVTIIYGPTINAATFQATLNKSPFPGFHPAANRSETVTIPLTSGHNTLDLEVEGLRSDGRTATDRDKLVFIVP
jgi:VCBS repeat-containing protein